MAVLAIRLADGVNGVCWLHGDVSRKMWHNVWPQVPPDEVPIQHVTNGIHTRSWLSSRTWRSSWIAISAVNGRPIRPINRCGKASCRFPTRNCGDATSAAASGWSAGRAQTLKEQLDRRGASFDEIAMADEVLDPEALTIGFARRFATYKRGALLLREPSGCSACWKTPSGRFSSSSPARPTRPTMKARS